MFSLCVELCFLKTPSNHDSHSANFLFLTAGVVFVSAVVKRRWKVPAKAQKHFVCEFCPQTFSWKSLLDRHLRTHTGYKPYSCDVCQLSFKTQHNVDSHMINVHNMACFTCQSCLEEFNSRRAYKSHLYTCVASESAGTGTALGNT